MDDLTKKFQEYKNTPQGQKDVAIMQRFMQLKKETSEIEAENAYADFLKILDQQRTLNFIPRGFSVRFPEVFKNSIPVPESMVNRVFFTGDPGKVDICEPMQGMQVVPKILNSIQVPNNPMAPAQQQQPHQ